MRWLMRLATPEDGLVLDPFCGSGSTGAAAVLESRRFLGIEASPEYAVIARARIGHWSSRNGQEHDAVPFPKSA
jgi:site-specific DNA-methyltransferase (adenine-specific)